MKKQLLLLVMMLLPVMANADAVEIDGIYYNLITKLKEAEVAKNPNKYSGSVAIPEKVQYEETEYSVTSIGSSAFSGCTGLTSITISNSVTSIGGSAFSGCTGLTSITIPNSVTSIGAYAFSSCSGLTSVTIPNSVMSIEAFAFGYCAGLTSVTIGNGVKTIGNYAFSGCSGLTSITIGNSVTKIGNWAFSSCTSLTSVTIPNNVKLIGDGAFLNCSGLTSVTIGSDVKTIYTEAFGNCPELTDVYCYAENVPYTITSAFEGSYIEYATLHVPTTSIDAYKSYEPWSNFKIIMGLDSTTPETQKCAKPTISYNNGQISFGCDTEGVEFVSSITDNDIKSYASSTIQLSVTYNITVYANKSGYQNSETATATLCWIDKKPQTEGITNGVANVPAQAVLIQSEGGMLTIQGVDDGTPVSVYSANGTQAGSAISQSGQAVVATNLQAGSVAIVKIGEKAVKVVIK